MHLSSRQIMQLWDYRLCSVATTIIDEETYIKSDTPFMPAIMATLQSALLNSVKVRTTICFHFAHAHSLRIAFLLLVQHLLRSYQSSKPSDQLQVHPSRHILDLIRSVISLSLTASHRNRFDI